jgi:hypothetical protein
MPLGDNAYFMDAYFAQGTHLLEKSKRLHTILCILKNKVRSRFVECHPHMIIMKPNLNTYLVYYLTEGYVLFGVRPSYK